MPVRRSIPYTEGLFFITFTCYNWLPLIAETNAYDLVYKWFNYLKQQNHYIVGYVIMPNHVHVMIDFNHSLKKLNTVIGDGKRFLAYDIINRLKEKGSATLLTTLANGVPEKDRRTAHYHEVWKESFDWKLCETSAFAYQKLIYMHGNPCKGKWMLAADITQYEHSSARYYISGKHAGYIVKDVEEVLAKIRERKSEG